MMLELKARVVLWCTFPLSILALWSRWAWLHWICIFSLAATIWQI